MELTVRTLRGSALLDAVADDITLDSLKARLHEAFAASLNVPVPERQSVVFAGRRLEHGPVKAAGVGAGATLVVLETAPLPSAAPHASVPAPTASEIRAAIVEEARRRGIEDQLVHDTPSLPRAPPTAPHDLMDMDNQLMGLIEALEGRLGQLRHAGGSGAASGGSGGDAVADAAAPTGTGAAPAAHAASGLAEPEDLEQVITPPEPVAELVSQLTDMGFSDALARKALVLHRNRVPEAVEWVLVHAEDALPPLPAAQEQLRRRLRGARDQRRGARRRTRVVKPQSTAGWRAAPSQIAVQRLLHGSCQ